MEHSTNKIFTDKINSNGELVKTIQQNAQTIEQLNFVESGMKSATENDEIKLDEIPMNIYIKNSIKRYSDLIKFQAASKLASRSLILNTQRKKTKKIFSRWIKIHSFDMLHFSLEKKLSAEGVVAVVLRKYGRSSVQPAMAKITSEKEHTSNTSSCITFLIESTNINGRNYNLTETHEYDFKKKIWNIDRKLINGKNESVPIDGIAYNLKEHETSKEPMFYIFENSEERVGDFENSIPLMVEHGKFSYWLYEKFVYLSPKVFNKSVVSGEGKEAMRKKMRDETFIDINSRAAQFQQPVTVFAPATSNEVIISTLKYFEDQIYMAAFSSRLSDGGKQAQQNDLEQALKNEMANNYIEFKKKLRQKQMTEFFKKIAAIEKWDFENTIVELQLSSTQERLLHGDSTGDK